MTVDEVQYLLAAPNASAGYTTAGTVYNSNGNWTSTTQVDLDVPLNNVFPDLTGPQNAAQQVDYQCVFVYNSDTTTAMANAWAWIPTSSVTSGAVLWAVGADPTGVSNYNATAEQAVLIANPYAVPAGVTFAGPSSNFSGGVLLGTIGPRQVFPVWIRRTATGVSAPSAAFNLQVTFDV